jgi:hypothetical protein
MGLVRTAKYAERHKLLDVQADIHSLVIKNNGKFLSGKTRSMEPSFLKYFVSRNDDDTSEEQVAVKMTS